MITKTITTKTALLRNNLTTMIDPKQIQKRRWNNNPSIILSSFSLRNILFASMPFYCYYFIAVEGFFFLRNDNSKNNNNNIIIPLTSSLSIGGNHKQRGGGSSRRKNNNGNSNSNIWRKISSSSLMNESYGRISTCPPGIRLFYSECNNENDDGENEIRDNNKNDDDDHFATDYHAPVMLNECIDALLNCERGRIRSNDMNNKNNHNDDDNDNEEEGKDQPVTDKASCCHQQPLIFVDGTLGGGGHSAALLQTLQPGDIVFGCDIDPNALQTASQRLSYYTNHSGKDRPLFITVQSNFGDLATKLPTVVHPTTKRPILQLSSLINNDNDDNNEDEDECDGKEEKSSSSTRRGVDGILLDLGVSSHQIDEPKRGFSYMRDGPLDMRMGSAISTTTADDNTNQDDNNNAVIAGDGDGGGLKAADICNEFDVVELQRIFSVYGDEPKAKTVAKAIVKHRPLNTTGELVDAIGSVTPKFAKSKRYGLTATCARIFQSLRIVVNNEDGVLSQVLSDACPKLLHPGGRLVVMSYHSMEDRATKRIMRDGNLEKTRSGRQRLNIDEKDMYGNYIGPLKPFKPISPKRRKATEEETSRNPRARSAILRVAERQGS